MLSALAALLEESREQFARAEASIREKISLPEFLQRVPMQRVGSIAAVAGLHLIVLLILFRGFAESKWKPPGIAATLIILPLAHVPLTEPHVPKFVVPQQDTITVPQIDVAVDDKPVQPMASGTSLLLLPPRPDPTHFNVSPSLPQQFKALASKALVELRVMVEPDGAISDAEVTQSTGNGNLDALAVDYVKEHWRFRPALLGSAPTRDWVTVICQFTAV